MDHVRLERRAERTNRQFAERARETDATGPRRRCRRDVDRHRTAADPDHAEAVALLARSRPRGARALGPARAARRRARDGVWDAEERPVDVARWSTAGHRSSRSV